MIEDFENGIAELLEVDSVNDTDILEDFESWDSLTSLSIIVFIDEKYKVSITRKDLMDAKTIDGLKQLIFSKSQNV